MFEDTTAKEANAVELQQENMQRQQTVDQKR